ncbi:MBL fold metallo-hydrolase [Sinorhizobium meliloti]|uniref:MBL fold metallo-hydrolase n=1 Tax=Rhizobium meliloti TaxID=382 RepID=UPI000FDC8565|nr:MBL fold metallo-hydrolase [Sinorhizobium meliloti]RVH78248.1 MBL fold metallo-hydrolase [Sinorhizobium meliloti]
MPDFYEIDFMAVETKKSGDAIGLRYSINNSAYIHVVDGGFQETGERLATHLRMHYNNPTYIDHVVVTHPDGDHTVGLRTILEEFNVGRLWMLRPWSYAAELLQHFTTVSTTGGLVKRLKDAYPNIAALEEIAIERNIPIYDPFQGVSIGVFRVLAPSRGRYLNCILESDRTPATASLPKAGIAGALASFFGTAAMKAVNYALAGWGVEAFSPEASSRENEMSVVQYAEICGHRIMLTGDAGRDALYEAVNFARFVAIPLPGIDRFQIPHHGSRRNLSSDLCDKILGPKLPSKSGEPKFYAYVSSAKEDPDHPRRVVVRACIHRGGEVYPTEGQDIGFSYNRTTRHGWASLTPAPYPQDQEEA